MSPTAADTLTSTPPRQDGPGWPAWCVLTLSGITFASLSLWAGLKSEDFLEADAIVHYLYARFAFTEHHLLTNVWGRPVCTIVYAPGALLAGLAGAHVVAMLIALGTGWITYRIARSQGYRWPALAAVFFLGQPLVFLHSFSVLTELPFALLLAAGFWAYQQRRWAVMALLAGLMPAARPEGLGFIALAAAALVLHRRAWWLLMLAAPMIVWSVAGWYFCDGPQPWYLRIPTWVLDNWPYSGRSLYQSGSLLHFLVTLPAVVGPIVFPAVLAGVWLSLGEGVAWWRMEHRRRCQVLIAAIPLLILAVHSFLFWTGRMASSGEPRYMMTVAPLWALLGAWGWQWAFVRCRWKRPVMWAGVAVLASILANVVYRVVPRRMDYQTERALEVVQWYQSSGIRDRYPKLAASHPAIYYFADVSLTDRQRSVEWRPETIATLPPGTVLVWDPMYGMFNADAQRTVEVKDVLDAGWVLAKVLKEKVRPVEDSAINRLAGKIQRDEVGRWYLFLSPTDISGQPTKTPAATTGDP